MKKVLAALVLLGGPAFDAMAQLDCPRVIPACRISPDRGGILQTRTGLMRECTALNAEIQRFRAQCGRVEKGSAMAARCSEEQGLLQARTDAFEDRRDAFDASLKCLDITAPDVRDRLPTVSPCRPMQGEATFIQKKLDELDVTRARHERQLASLQRDARMMNGAARDVDDARSDAIMESAGNALDVIEAGFGTLSAGAGAGEAASRRVVSLIATAKAGLSSVGATVSRHDDPKKAVDRTADALLELGNLANNVRRSDPRAEALQHALAATLRLVRASESIAAQPGSDRDWRDYLAALDDVIDAVSQFAAPLRAARATGQILDLEAAQWHLSRSREVIDTAFVANSSARRLYGMRMDELEKLTAFYRDRLECVRAK